MSHRPDKGVLYDLYQRHPQFRKLVENSDLLDSLKKIVGPDILLYENSLVYKKYGTANAVPWHQDFINRPDEIKKYVAWIALTDVTVANGALKVIPGSHKLGFKKFYQVEGEAHHTRLDLNGVDVSNFKHICLKSGDVLIFDQLLIHGSDHVEAGTQRLAYRFSCQSMAEVFVPRGIPLVITGGHPEDRHKFQMRKKENRTNILRSILHKIGGCLTRL